MNEIDPSAAPSSMRSPALSRISSQPNARISVVQMIGERRPRVRRPRPSAGLP
jgi:hypothetical protein